MNKKIIIAIIGESGAGKDTFAWALHDFCEWNMVTLSTTRPIRDYEVEDEDYYFIDDQAELHQIIEFNISILQHFKDRKKSKILDKIRLISFQK